MSKNKVSSNKDNKNKNPSDEDNVKIDQETDTKAVNVDENGDEDISIEDTVENQKKWNPRT